MSGYRRVNYYELCRLCTSSEGNQIHIFRDEGRKRAIPSKIQSCLSFQLSEDDSLPKNICFQCEEKLENFHSFKEACLDAGNMLTKFFSTIRFSDDFLKNGMVYIRDTSQNESKESASEAEDHCTAFDKTTVNNHSQSPEVNQVSSSTSKVAATTKNQAMSNTHNNYSFRGQIEAQNASLSGENVHGVPSQVVVVNSNYMGFNNGSLMNGNMKRESPLNNNHMMNSSPSKSPSNFQTSSGMHLKETDENVDQHLFHGRKKKKTLVEMAGNNMGDALKQDNNPYQEYRLQLGLTNEDKESATNFMTENEQKRTSEAETQIGEFAFFKLKTETSMDDGSMGEEHGGEGSMHLPDCEMSDREYASNEELTGHVVGYEGADAETPSKRKAEAVCEICNKGFRRKEHLHQHMKLHTGERPYKCSQCDKRFSRKEHLIRHSVSHTGEKCHPCYICGKTFSRKDNLHKHKKTHGVTGPYVCEECGKSFLIKHYYLLHQTTHSTPEDQANLFKCDICDKVFATKQYLRSHKVRHERKSRKAEAKELQTQTTNTGPPSLPPPPSEAPPLTTINAQAILPPNLLQVPPTLAPFSTNVASISTANPIFQVCNMTGKQTFVMSVASKQLMETFRKLNSS